jgi:tRNA 2-thiouridine synthesizing protein A
MLELDVRGLACPMPILRLRKLLSSLDKGQTIQLRVTDRAALRDVPLFCHQMHHVLERVEANEAGDEWTFVLTKGG